MDDVRTVARGLVRHSEGDTPVVTSHHSVGDAVGLQSRRGLPRPSRRRQTVLVTLAATALGLGFGLAAPSVSPVGPTPPPVSSPASRSEAAGTPNPAIPIDPGPVAPAAPADPAAPAGPDRPGGHIEGFNRSDQHGRH